MPLHHYHPRRRPQLRRGGSRRGAGLLADRVRRGTIIVYRFIRRPL